MFSIPNSLLFWNKILNFSLKNVYIQGVLANGRWKSRSDSISFASFRMIITRHYLEGSTKERTEAEETQEVLEESEECPLD